MITWHTLTSHQIIHHKSLNTSLKKSAKDYPEIFQVLKYLNNQSHITKKHWKNVEKKNLKNIQPNLQQNNTKRRTRKIIWFNPPFSLNVKANVAKALLQLVDTHFSPANKLHKTFNRNTIKVNYNCTQNLSQVIKAHNRKVTQIKRHNQLECKCCI